MVFRQVFVVGFVVVELITFACSYYVSYLYGHLTWPMLYFSNSISHAPGHNVGILGVGTGCLLWTAVAIWYYVHLANKIRQTGGKRQEALSFWNELTLVCTWTSALGAAAVLAIPLHTNELLHYMAASVFFGPQILYQWIQVICLDKLTLEEDKTLLGLRRRLVLAEVPLMAAMVSFFLLGRLLGVDVLIFLSVVCELVLCGIFMAFAGTHYGPLRKRDQVDPLFPSLTATRLRQMLSDVTEVFFCAH